jgi:hypothetical protein
MVESLVANDNSFVKSICSRLYDEPIDMSHTLFWEKHLLLLLFIQLTRQTSDISMFFRLKHELTTEKKQRRLLDDKTDKSIQISHIFSSDTRIIHEISKQNKTSKCEIESNNNWSRVHTYCVN